MADETVHADDPAAPPPGEAVHLPGPTYVPVVTALGLTIAICGIVLSYILLGIGLVITALAVRRWIADTRGDISELPLEH
jgi:tellurite resistance protein TehA-like permease